MSPAIVQLNNRLSSLRRHFVSVRNLRPSRSVARFVRRIFRLRGRRRAMQIAARCWFVAFHGIALRVAPLHAGQARLPGRRNSLDFPPGAEAIRLSTFDQKSLLPPAAGPFAIVPSNDKGLASVAPALGVIAK